MMRIVRPRCRKNGQVEEIRTRGPFLTQAREFDAGWRRIVIELHGDHIRFRHQNCRRWVHLTYAQGMALARRQDTRMKALIGRTEFSHKAPEGP